MTKTNQIQYRASILTIALAAGISGCTNTPTSLGENTLSGQKAIKGPPPPQLVPQGAGAEFGYDFNRDGTTDWVLKGGGKTIDTVIIQLSQPGGKYKTITQNQFDPDIAEQSYNFDWRVTTKLTDSGELYITNNNIDPMSSSDAMSSYRFRFINGEFVLRGYTHGYTGHTWGRYRHSYIYDLAKLTMQESDTERCDETPEEPCKTAKTYQLRPGVPKITLEKFNEARDIAKLTSFSTKPK